MKRVLRKSSRNLVFSSASLFFLRRQVFWEVLLKHLEVVQGEKPPYRSPNLEVRLLSFLVGAPWPFSESWGSPLLAIPPSCHLISQAASPTLEWAKIAKAVTHAVLAWKEKKPQNQNNQTRQPATAWWMESLIRDGALALTVENVFLNERG